MRVVDDIILYVSFLVSLFSLLAGKKYNILNTTTSDVILYIILLLYLQFYICIWENSVVHITYMYLYFVVSFLSKHLYGMELFPQINLVTRVEKMYLYIWMRDKDKVIRMKMKSYYYRMLNSFLNELNVAGNEYF